MPDDNKSESKAPATPNNRKVNADQVKVRMIGKQSIAEAGAVYHPERKAGGVTTPADTFTTTRKRAEALEDHVTVIEEAEETK